MPETFPPSLKLILLYEDLLGPALLVQSLEISGRTERVKFIAVMAVREFTDFSGTCDDLNMDWREGDVIDATPIATTHSWFIV